MNCPVCSIALVMTERQGIEIDYCPTCRGIWLDRGELDKIIERSLPAQQPAAQPPRYTESHDRSYDRHHGDHGENKHHKKRSFLHDLFD